jgi:hypothetical protein
VLNPIDKKTNLQLRVRINTTYEIRICKKRKEMKDINLGAKKLLPKNFRNGATIAGYKGPYKINEIGGSSLILYKGLSSDNIFA